MANVNHINLHGVFVNIDNVGVLITGLPGVGKSQLALQLIERKQQLVADDIVVFAQQEQELIGYCPENLQDFLKIRGLEIFNIRKLFGHQALCHQHSLNLIIDLVAFTPLQLLEQDAMLGLHDFYEILGKAIPRITVSANNLASLPLTVETLVKNHLLKIQGYDAEKDFIQRHDKQMGLELCA